MHIMQAKAA